MGKVIGIMSFKGGVGKTVSAINIASALVRFGKRVLIVDANFLSPSLNIYLGLLNPEISLREVLRNKMMAEDAIYEHKTGIHVLPCNFYRNADTDLFKIYIEHLRKKYDYIILDSGPTYTDEILAVLQTSDELIFVTTPDYPTLVSTIRAAELSRHKNIGVRGVLVNRKRKKKFELNSGDIEKTIGMPVIAEILDDNDILKATSQFVPSVYFSPRSKNSKRYIQLAKKIIDEDSELFNIEIKNG